MKKLRKLLILDDDPHYSGMLALKLRMQFPELVISASQRNKVLPGYDIYILDNDFSGDECGAKLAEEVRSVAPESLVAVLSGTLEFSLLKRLVNCHAAGVFDKSDDDDLVRLIELIDRYLLAQHDSKNMGKKESKNVLVGISDLLSEWNRRLAFEEKRLS